MAQQWNGDGNFWYDDGQFDATGNPLKSDFDTWLGTVSGNAPLQPKVKNYLTGLQTNYGLTTGDFDNALKAYGANYGDGGFLNDKDVGWWGEDAMLRAFGTGLDKLNPDAAYKGSWQSIWNQGAENAQQKDFADRFAANEANQGSDLSDLGDIMKGVGLVTGVAGLAGAFGAGSGMLGGGADVIGSDFAAGVGGSLGGVPGDIAMSAATAGGTTAPGWTSGADLPGVDSGLTDASWGVNPQAGGAATNTGGASMDDWLEQLIQETGTGYGTPSTGNPLDGLFDTTGVGTPGGQITGDTGSDWSTGGSNPGSGSVYNPGNQGPDLWDTLKSQLSGLPPGTQTAIKSLLTGGTGTAAATSAIGRILGGTGTASDWASVLGQAGTGVLDYMGQKERLDLARSVDERNWNAGAGSRGRYEAAMSPGFDINTMPGYKQAMDTATETYLRKLSATGGNPAGIGAAPSQTMAYTMGTVGLPAWQQYVNQNANAGGIGALSSGSTGTGMALADTSGGTYNSLGKSVGAITNPTMSIRDLLTMGVV